VDPFHLSQHLKAIKYHKKIQEKQSAVTKTDVTILINYFFALSYMKKSANAHCVGKMLTPDMILATSRWCCDATLASMHYRNTQDQTNWKQQNTNPSEK